MLDQSLLWAGPIALHRFLWRAAYSPVHQGPTLLLTLFLFSPLLSSLCFSLSLSSGGEGLQPGEGRRDGRGNGRNPPILGNFKYPWRISKYVQIKRKNPVLYIRDLFACMRVFVSLWKPKKSTMKSEATKNHRRGLLTIL